MNPFKVTVFKDGQQVPVELRDLQVGDQVTLTNDAGLATTLCVAQKLAGVDPASQPVQPIRPMPDAVKAKLDALKANKQQ